MTFPSAVPMVQSCKAMGEWDLLYLPSVQADRGATNWVTLIECRAVTSLPPAPTSLCDVLASDRCQGVDNFNLSVTHHCLNQSIRGFCGSGDGSRFYNINHLPADAGCDQ
jgi:hypothetical protein